MIDTSGPAFPVQGQGYIQGSPGMTLRDYIAAQSIPGLIPNYQRGEEAIIAECAYAIADAMIAERGKA